MQRDWLQFDSGQAMMAMMIEAADLGIGTGHAAIADQDLLRRLLGVPDGPLRRRPVLARLPRRPPAEAAAAPRPAALRGRRPPRALVAPTPPGALRHDAPVPNADRAWVTDVQVCPSILAADFGAFRSQVRELLDAGARTFHVDVMDGHFVPVITFGHGVVEAIAGDVHERGGALAVHLMVERPERFVDDYARAGADSFTVHVEATVHLHRTLQLVREAGMVPGVTLNPATPVGLLVEAAREADNLLCMSVNPGWGGQSFIPASLERVRQLRALARPGAGRRDRRRHRPRDHRRRRPRGRQPADGRLRDLRGARARRDAYRDLVERVRAAGPPGGA